MPKYIVPMKEIWIQEYLVEAETIEEAVEKAKEGDLEFDECFCEFEYSETIDVLRPEHAVEGSKIVQVE